MQNEETIEQRCERYRRALENIARIPGGGSVGVETATEYAGEILAGGGEFFHDGRPRAWWLKRETSQFKGVSIASVPGSGKSADESKIQLVSHPLISLKAGEKISGYLHGRGEPATFSISRDVPGAPPMVVETWLLRRERTDGGLTDEFVRVLTSIQLEKKLPSFIGRDVTIERGSDELPPSNQAGLLKVASYEVTAL